jgi:hypothetical protein
MSETIVFQKIGIPITNTDPNEKTVRQEIARDSWPKLVTERTHYVGDTDDGKHVFEGVVDTDYYSSEKPVALARDHENTVAVHEP